MHWTKLIEVCKWFNHNCEHVSFNYGALFTLKPTNVLFKKWFSMVINLHKQIYPEHSQWGSSEYCDAGVFRGQRSPNATAVISEHLTLLTQMLRMFFALIWYVQTIGFLQRTLTITGKSLAGQKAAITSILKEKKLQYRRTCGEH